METRKIFLTLVTAAGISVSASCISIAAPASGSAIRNLLQDNSLVLDARVFCFNRRTKLAKLRCTSQRKRG